MDYHIGRGNQQIRQIYQKMVHEIRNKVVADDISGRRLAAITGLSEATLRRVRDDDWSPSIETALLCEEMLFPDPPPLIKSFSIIRPEEEIMRKAVLGVDRRERGASVFTQFILDARLAPVIEPRQFGPAVEYLRRRDTEEALDATCSVLRVLAPNCAVHLFVADGEPENWFAEIWDNSTGYQGGKDLRGIRVHENKDPLYVEAMVADYFAVVKSCAPLFSAIERQPDNDEPRSFLRFMQALPDINGVRKLIIITAPQEPGFCLYALRYLLSGGPEQG